MTISRLTVDKLGVKLYDRVSAVIAEIVANSYDADATQVIITAPSAVLLAREMRCVPEIVAPIHWHPGVYLQRFGGILKNQVRRVNGIGPVGVFEVID